jgi:AcrR family transcriptional regulator
MSKSEGPTARKDALQRGTERRPRKADVRIRRTRGRLGDALVALMHEKAIGKITVQEVLDQAGVGRSTFYLHYRDKDDLFLCVLEEGLEMWSTALDRSREKALRVVPVAEFFAHVASARKLYRALADAERLNDYFDLAQGYFARGIEQRLKNSQHLAKLPRSDMGARATALAGSLLSLLRWWMDRGARETPRAIDELFHRIVWKGVS